MYVICRNLLSWSPIIIFHAEFGVIRFIIALTYLISISLVLFWSKIQVKNVQVGHSTDSILFPHFIRLLYLLALIDLLTILTLLILEVILEKYSYGTLSMIFYCLCGALQHIITEGIAVLFLQKGCGYYSFHRVRNFAVFWMIFVFFCYFFIYSDNFILNIFGWMIWIGIMIGYYALWLLPSKYLFRRSAAKAYGKYWAIYKTLLLVSFVLLYIRSQVDGASYGYCGVYVVGFFGYAIFHPLIIYWALLEDSRWWQGIMDPPTPHGSRQASRANTGDHGTHTSITDLRTPLIGADLSLVVAITLAGVVDRIGANSSVKILNFAHIHLTSQRKLLGRGSFSKVYRGVYQKMPCAVKLIFTTDLTEEVISRVTAEATLLSAVQSPNIVKIIGISVLPPSVCMVLELCAYGSLSDILRGSDSGRIPFYLSERDQLFLALGCARGVAALHSLSAKIVHRDIKSFNFLVDHQFNAKLADLELGVPALGDNVSHDGPKVEDFLVNWLAPEVLRGDPFSQSSDVYSLVLVFHEILTRLIPYDDIPALRETPNATIKELVWYLDSPFTELHQVIRGYRPPLSSSLFSMSHFLSIIERGWSPNPTQRPTAAEIVLELEDISLYFFPTLNPLLQSEVKIARSLTHYYNKLSKRSYSQPFTASLSIPSGQSLAPPSIGASQLMRSSKTPIELGSDLYGTLPDVFEQMIVESSPWSDVLHNPEPLIILSCCAPHVILYASKVFLSVVLKCSASQDASILRMLFGTDLSALTSPSNPIVSTSQPLPSKPDTSNQNATSFQQFYHTTLTRGNGQMVTSFCDVSGNPHLCLLHGYAIYNCENSPFDYSLYQATRYYNSSSSEHHLSSISLSSSFGPSSITQAAGQSYTVPPPPIPSMSIKDLQKSGEILYMVVAVSPLLFMTEPRQSLRLDGIHESSHASSSSFRDSSSYSTASKLTRQSSYSSPHNKRLGSEGSLSQSLFLLYETERALSVEEEGLYDQENPYEGATIRPADRLSSSTCLSHHFDNPPLNSRSSVDGPMTSSLPPGTPSSPDHELLNDL